MTWGTADEQGIVDYLVGEKQFNEERIRNAVKKLNKLKSGSVQGRLDGFFKVTPRAGNANAPAGGVSKKVMAVKKGGKGTAKGKR